MERLVSFNALTCVRLSCFLLSEVGRNVVMNFFSRYKILEELGDGTCGTVYKALDWRSHEIVSFFV